MKKLLLVLTVVAMASFLFVGCDFPGAPPVDPPVEPPVEPTAITATIGVATETAPNADGKIFVKGGSREITVTFSDVVENPVVKVGTVVVPLFTVDNKVFKGPGAFVGNGAVLITVGGVCDDDLCEAKSVVVDSIAPVVELEAKAAECDCEDSYALTITSEQKACDGCVVDPGCCEDAGSGVASWNVQIFDANPWEIPYVDPCTEPDCEPCCSEDPCIDPIAELDGTACPITITTECIDEVWTEVAEGVNDWVGYFDKEYFVIATLTDNVGNKTTYKGLVSPSTVKADNYVSYFAEIYHGADTVAADYEDYLCWCYAEDETAADSVLGDCAGTPTTECWVEPLDPCPEVKVVPAEPVVGQPAKITIDYTDAVKPTGTVSAYVGPAFKTLPLGVPEGSSALPLEEVEDYFYEANVVFGEAGDRIIYVVDACEDCPPCTYNITVLPADVCPVVEFLDNTFMLGDVPGYGLTNVDFTVTFANKVEKELVKVYVGIPGLAPIAMPIVMPPTTLQLSMTTADEITYNGSVPIGDLKYTVISWLNHYFGADDPYDEDWIDPEEPWEEIPELALAMHALGCVPLEIYVLAGDPCCIQVCEYPFIIDPIGPYASLEVTVESCTITECIDPGACGPCEYSGHKIVVDTLEEGICDDIECCDDTCSGVASWYAQICPCDDNPFDECCIFEGCDNDDCVDVGGPWTGTGCDVEFATDCLYDYVYPHEGAPYAEIWGSTWYLYVEMVDNAGNVTEYKASMTIDTSNWSWNVIPLCEDAEDGVFGAIVCSEELPD